MSAPAIVRRRLRLAVIVAVASGIVAVGLTGAGLLLPGGSDTPWIRILGAGTAVAAGAVLVRIDGAARGTTTLAIVAATATVLCLLTLPVSPVTLPGDRSTDGADRGDAGPSERGDGAGPEVVIEPGPGGGGSRGAVALPQGADVVVEGGNVVVVTPSGARVVVGVATLEGAHPTIPEEGTPLTVVDGVVTRGDGGPIGDETPLGGTTFQRADGSRVSVGEGVLHDVPTPFGVDGAESDTDARDAIIALLLGAFALVAFAPPLLRIGERVPVSLLDGPEPAPDPAPEPSQGPTVEDGLAGVLRSMLADPDPRTSVIGAYGRLLAAMAEAGSPRRAEEGPHEHLWRTLGPLGVRPRPVHRLAALFVRARFTPRPVTEVDRQAAIAALADAVADLRLQATDVTEAASRAGAAT